MPAFKERIMRPKDSGFFGSKVAKTLDEAKTLFKYNENEQYVIDNFMDLEDALKTAGITLESYGDNPFVPDNIDEIIELFDIFKTNFTGLFTRYAIDPRSSLYPRVGRLLRNLDSKGGCIFTTGDKFGSITITYGVYSNLPIIDYLGTSRLCERPRKKPSYFPSIVKGGKRRSTRRRRPTHRRRCATQKRRQ